MLIGHSTCGHTCLDRRWPLGKVSASVAAHLASSSFVFPAISLGFTILLLLLLLCSQLYLWGSLFFFFFFCVPSYISGVHYSSSSSSVFPAISLGFTILLLLLTLLLMRSRLYIWCSPFFLFFCVPSYISWVHHSSSSSDSSSSAFPTTFFLFFCVPSYISWVHHSSSSAFPAMFMVFTILLRLLRSQLAISLGFTSFLLMPSNYISGVSPFFFLCVPSYVSGVHNSSSSTQLHLLGLPFLGEFFAYVIVFKSNQ